MKINSKELKALIRECVEEVLNESVTNKVDNFNYAKGLLNLTDPNQFFYIQVIKRFKDNKGMTKNVGDTYHAGGEYGNLSSGTAFKVRTANELAQIEQQIKQYCDANNARCYMVCNPRNQQEIDNFMPTYLSGLKRHNGGALPTYAKHAEDILSGRPRSAKDWPDMRFFLDIDIKKDFYYIPKNIKLHTVLTKNGDYVVYDSRFPELSQCKTMFNKQSRTLYVETSDQTQIAKILSIGGINVWDGTHEILKRHSINIEHEYETPSNGLHVFVSQLSSVKNLAQLEHDLRIFDDGVDLGKCQTVHINLDGKLILYSNVTTGGY